MGIQDRQYYQGDSYGGSYGTSMSGMRLVTRIVILNVVIWLIYSFTAPDLITKYFALDTNLFRGHFFIWQLLTAGFLHEPLGASANSIFHIGFNMFILWQFGREIEDRLGWKEFLRFYLLAIVFANLVWYASTVGFNWKANASVIGASGAVAAVVILFVVYYPKRTLLLMGVIPMPAWLLGVLFVGMDMVNAILNSSSGYRSGVAYSAHLGGAAFGYAYFRFKWRFGTLTNWLALDQWGKSLSRPRLKIHRGDDSREQKLDRDADRVLDKLHREGEASLTNKERKILEAYSRQVRKRKSN